MRNKVLILKGFIFVIGFFMFYVLVAGCTSKQKKEIAISGTDSTIQTVIVSKDTTDGDSLAVTLNSREIDSPISLAEIENYDQRVTIQRCPKVPITYKDAYKIWTKQYVYPADSKQIQLHVYNTDGPTASLGYHRMEHWENGEWLTFPFIDNLSFSGPDRILPQGDVLPEYIYMREFKNPLKPNKYKVHFSVFAKIYTYCTLTDSNIQSVKDSEKNRAFGFRILDSKSDSIRILFENHTNLSVLPLFLPSVGTDELYSVHPLAQSGWIGEANWMKKHALLKGGESMLFKIPTSWDVNRLKGTNVHEKYKSGKLIPGTYKIGLQLEIYMSTEFKVNENES